jgi:hypothetical protein
MSMGEADYPSDWSEEDKQAAEIDTPAWEKTGASLEKKEVESLHEAMEHGLTKEYEKTEVVRCIRKVANIVNEPPLIEQIDEHSCIDHNIIYNHFDSLMEARRAAGVGVGNQ